MKEIQQYILRREIRFIQFMKKGTAPGEARTHGLQIMRLTRCRLRYRGVDKETRLTNTLLILITGIRIAITK